MRYIKLGAGNANAAECIASGTLGLGFDNVPHDVCQARDWKSVRDHFLLAGKDAGKATAHTTELQKFCEAGPETLWITFADERLWWAFADGGVTFDNDRIGNLPRRRTALSGWSSTDIHGDPLLIRRLNPKLTSLTAFRATVCEVDQAAYATRRINGVSEDVVVRATALRQELHHLARQMIVDLHPRDFEILVDLIFAASGWRRVSVLGETQADADLFLEQVVTRERAFVQVKSRATPPVLADYTKRFRKHDCDRMFFVCHSPSSALRSVAPEAQVDLWFDEDIADRALRARLFDWLVERTK